MRIVVTGSSGMIGTRLCERLMDVHEVVPVDIRPNVWNRQIDEATVLADLRCGGCLDYVTGRIDMVIHCAANARVHALVEQPDGACDNLLMTHNVLEYVRSLRVPRIVFTSSREVYGSVSRGRSVREDAVALWNCESPYAASKMAAEAWVHSYHQAYGVGYVIVRLSNVYGMYDDSDRLIPLWLRCCNEGRSLVIYGADNELDFTYIDDAVSGIEQVVERFELAATSAINIASGQATSLLEVAGLFREIAGGWSEVTTADNRPGEIVTYQADISRARVLLGYSPKVGIREGIQRAVAWYRENPAVLGDGRVPAMVPVADRGSL